MTSISELQNILHKLVNAWIATGELYEWVATDQAWKTTGIHDPQRRSLHENALEFMEYRDWRSRLKVTVDEGGAGWEEAPHQTPELRGMENPRFQAYEIMRQLLSSSGRERFHIAKCTACGVFFWRDSLSYAKRGLFCSTDCQNKRSSKDTRKEQRDALLEKRLDRAAAAFAKSRRTNKAKTTNNYNFKVEIVEAVNAGQGSDEDDIKLTWVSRHWETIADRAAQNRKERSK